MKMNDTNVIREDIEGARVRVERDARASPPTSDSDSGDGAEARERERESSFACRPPHLSLSAIKLENDQFSPSPGGPLSVRAPSSSSSMSSKDDEEDEEAEGARACVIQFMDGDTVADERVVNVRRLDVILRRKLAGTTYVVAKAHTELELSRCRVNGTFHMHALRMSGDEDETSGYAAHDFACLDDVNDVSADEHTVSYYVVNDDPFDSRLYGVTRVVRRDAAATARRFGVRDLAKEFGVDVVVDRFFASSCSREMEGVIHGAEFVRQFMIDALRVELKSKALDGDFTIPIVSAAPIRVAGASRHDHIDSPRESLTYDGIMVAEDIMAEREDWVMRRFFKLYGVPTSRRNGRKQQSWRDMKMLSPAKDPDSPEDVLEEENLVTQFHAIAKLRPIQDEALSASAGEGRGAISIALDIAKTCKVIVEDGDDATARSIFDAVACALRTDGGLPSHDIEFEASSANAFQSAVRAIRGDEPATKRARAVVCSRTHISSASTFIASLKTAMKISSVDTCVLVARCSKDADGSLLLGANDGSTCISMRDALASAANHGLFTDGGVFKSHPMANVEELVVAVRFIQRHFRIRASTSRDVDALIAIEAEAWVKTPEMRTASSIIVERVTNNAAMNFVVEDIATSVVRGAMYAQYIEDVDAASQTTWETKETNRRAVGTTNVVQLLDVFVDQDYGSKCASGALSVGQELRNHVLHLAEQSNVLYACAVTRTRGFRDAQARTSRGLAYEAYVRGRALDRGVFFHTSAGAEIMQIVSPWRPKDYENDGNGVLIRYDVGEYSFSQAARRGRHRSAKKRRPSDPTSNGGEYVNSVQAIAWEARARAFPSNL